MKQKKKPIGGGNWRGFFRFLRQINLPWFTIALAFCIDLGYNQALLFLPTTTAGLLSGNLEDSALRDAIMYYILYGSVVTVNGVFKGLTCRLALRNARIKIWGGMTRIKVDYYDQHTPTALISAVTNDLELSVQMLVQLMIGLLPSFYYLFSAIETIGNYHILLVVSVLLPLPLQYLYSMFLGRWNYRTQSGIYQRIGVLTGYLAERVKNLPLIKHFGTEPEELENGQAAAEALFKANMKATKVTCIASGIRSGISVISKVIVVLFGALLLRNGQIDMTQWVAFFMFSTTIYNRFVTLGRNWESLKTIQGQVARVVELVEAPKEQTEQEAKEAASLSVQPGASPAVTFQNVSFSYGEKQALKNVSFTVPAGTATAIVGLTGSGKTTMLNLLERFYETGEGSVTLDGQDVKEMTLGQLRSRYSYVQQDAGVFSGTVREALTYGINRTVSDDEMITAAQSAGAWDFVEKMPGQLDAVISADGSSLSGGQRQRLVLAREFLRNADVLLLDEPTSALDAKTAQAVEKTIFDLFRGKTILMVTHDMSLVSGMNQIVVLQNGECVGRGTYEELLISCPFFAEMVHSQQGEGAVA